MTARTMQKQAFPLFFFILAFAITWAFWFPGILDAINLIELPVPFIVFFFAGTWGPFLAATLAVYREEKWMGVRRFWRRGLDFHISPGWVLIILLVALLTSAFPLGVHLLLGGTAPDWSLLQQPWMILPVFLTYFFTGGGNEEWGWRGYALDRLQCRWSPLKASLVLGVIWGTWHFPLFFIESTGQYHMSLLVFLLAAPALSVLHTWVYNGTGGNLVAAWLFHAVLGTAWEFFPIVQPGIPGYQRVHIFDFSAVILVAAIIVLQRMKIWTSPATPGT